MQGIDWVRQVALESTFCKHPTVSGLYDLTCTFHFGYLPLYRISLPTSANRNTVDGAALNCTKSRVLLFVPPTGSTLR
jgi:hypothetical protein